MRLSLWLLAGALIFAGCSTDIPPSDPPAEQSPEAFGPVKMRIHPVFTQVVDWNHEGKATGMDVVLEFQDRFGDPTKAIGRVVFELYGFRQTSPEQRGNRLSNPWIGSLETIPDQEAHWNRTSRAYSFRLDDSKITFTTNYVLTATFEQQGGGRFFDQIILQGKKAKLNQVKVKGKTGIN